MAQAATLSGTSYSTWQKWEYGTRRTPPIALDWLRLKKMELDLITQAALSATQAKINHDMGAK